MRLESVEGGGGPPGGEAMGDRGRMVFPDDEIWAIARMLRATRRWQVRYLADILRSLPDVADSFRTTRFETPPSHTEIFLQQVVEDPVGRLRRLLNRAADESPSGAFDRVLQIHDGLAQLKYQVARLLSPTGRAEAHLHDDAVRRVLVDPELEPALVEKAARSAQASLARIIRRGKGTDRRSGNTPVRLAVDHLLETYKVITDRLPHVTNNTAQSRIDGHVVEYLRTVLPKVGFAVPSGSTLRRWIDAFRLPYEPPKRRPLRFVYPPY